jgi:oligoendopeptidase F
MRQCGCWVLLVFVFAAGASVGGQTTNTSAALSADLSRYYFKSPEDEVAARSELNAALDRIAGFNGRLDSAVQLLKLLQQQDAFQRLLARHEEYLHLRCSLNRKDAACEGQHKLESDFEPGTLTFDSEIQAIPQDRLGKFLQQEPKLAKYRYALEEVRNTSHDLPEPQQNLLDEFLPEIADWQYDLYGQVISGINFGTVQTTAGTLDVTRQRNLIAASTDEHVREEGFKKRYAGFASQRDLLAFALIHTVRANEALAKAHHYSSAPDRKYDSLGFKPQQTRDLLNAMAQRGDIGKHYEKIRLRELELQYRHPANVWDLSATAPGFSAPVTPLSEVQAIFHEAFAGLGSEYQSAFDALLDPANGRADILPGGAANRYGGGFSVGSGGTGILFYGRYDGTFKDLSVIAHEGGHATHRQLMNLSGVPPSYAHGPHYLFESFAAFNELVLADFMAGHASTPEARAYYRNRWMSIKGLDAFDGAEDALLEQAIYEGVSAGTVRSADDLDKLTVKNDSQFSEFPPTVPELRNRWAAASLMFEDPLYDVNYVYGGLLALKYDQLYSTRREWFVPRYIALLKNGFDQPAEELLKKFLEIDISSPSFLNDDLDLLNHRLDEMEAAAKM